MDPLLIVMIIVSIIGWTGAVMGAVLAFISARRATGVAQLGGYVGLNQYIDQRVDELVAERLGDIKLRTLAFSRIIRAVAAQWPTGHPPPLLDPADIKAVEESIPSAWIKPRSN